MAITSETDQWGPIWDGTTATGLGSAGLLERFANGRDPASFEAIIQHHGPMVLATCRRILTNPDDADDAFQATFLVLARQARAIRDPDRLAPWLHQVAHRVALRARARSARRRRVEGEGRGDLVVAPSHDSTELRTVLDEELARLPAKYRDPLVLCYLEGLTHDEAANQLDCPVGTVRSRLAGGRDRLRGRLTRRGFAPGALAILGPSPLPVAVVSRALLVATARLVLTGGSGKVASSAALVLAQGVLTSMFLAKVQTITVATLAVAATLTAGSVALSQGPGGPAPVPAPSAAPVQKSKSPPHVDPARLRVMLAEWERLRREQWPNRGDGPDAILRAARASIEIPALERRLAGFPKPEPISASETLRQDQDRLHRLVNEATPELTEDAEYIRDFAKFRDQAQAKLDALEAQTSTALKPVDEPLPAAVEPKQEGRTVQQGLESKPAPEREPIVITLPGSPTILMVTSGRRDRVTMIDPATQKRATLRLAQPAGSINPRSNASELPSLDNQANPDRKLIEGLVGLEMSGPKIEKVAVFDRNAMRWFEHDLPQPASLVQPDLNQFSTLVGFSALYLQPTRELVAFDAKTQTWPTVTLPEPVGKYIPANVSIQNTVTFEAGRFLGIYSQAARKSSVLTLNANRQHEFEGEMLRSVNPRFTNFQNGKLIIADGDLIHIYDPKTGEWVEINTLDDQ